MKLGHQLKDQKVERDVEESSPLGFFISNKAGGMLFFDARKDRTQFYAKVDDRTIKVIHDLNASTKVTGINHRFHSLEVRREGEEHEIFVPQFMNALLVNSRSEEPIQFVLEMKDLDGSSNREHALSQKQGRIVIRSDASGSGGNAVFTAIQGDDLQYDFSKRLNDESGHSQLVLDIFASKISVGVSSDESDAITLANHLFINEGRIKEVQESCLAVSKGFKDPEAALAYACVINSTDHMLMHGNGGDAKRPFFSKAGSPHTSIAMHSLLLDGEFKLAKAALLEEIALQHRLLVEGRSRFEEVAWPMLLFGRLLNNICSKGKLYTYFTADELKDAASKVAQIVNMVDAQHSAEIKGIESQVLMLAVYDLAYALTKSGIYGEKESALKSAARSSLLAEVEGIRTRGHAVMDDAKDIFLTAYIYPILTDDKGWRQCFDTLLESMHGTFGIFRSKAGNGAGSGSLKLELFGLQSLAAIVLNRSDGEKYEKQINSVLRDAVNEVLYKGIIGRPTSSFGHEVDPEKEALVEDAHLVNNALFLEMLRECA